MLFIRRHPPRRFTRKSLQTRQWQGHDGGGPHPLEMYLQAITRIRKDVGYDKPGEAFYRDFFTIWSDDSHLIDDWLSRIPE